MRPHLTPQTSAAIVAVPLVTVAQAAEILAVSMKTVQRRITSGDLPVVRDGRLVRIHPEDLDRYIRARRG